ncbi:MAG: hypothetical protein ABSC60_18865, partial [Acidobacteriota bacterium]
MRFSITARVPELAKQMKQHAARLSEFLNDPVTFQNQLSEELVLAEVTIRSLKEKLSGHPRRITA